MFLKKNIGYFLSALIISCSSKTPQQKLTDFINDPKNNMMQSKNVGDIRVIAKWLPHQYRYPNADTVQIPIEKGSIPETIKKEDLYYFNVRFEKATADKLTNEKASYLKFDLQNDFTLLCAGDTLPPVFCKNIKKENAGSYEYVVVFNSPTNSLYEHAFTLCYTDKIFDMGIVAFAYSEQDIAKVPVF
jgi:hypothetical protein